MDKSYKLAESVKPYEGKWVALVEDTVIASGETPLEVKEKADEIMESYAFFKVPSSSTALK